MEKLHWELSVLSRAVHYRNLSGAADHVGISQPQLSRIVSKLENALKLVLLDRSARRKSGWTPTALRLAEIYLKNERLLQHSLQALQTDDVVTHLNVGLLEGLIELASEVTQSLLKNSRVQILEINVFDLSELEERFTRDELDLVFTCREPGRHKYNHLRTLGYQTLVPRLTKDSESKESTQILSPFEFANRAQKKSRDKDGRVVISNSLAVRKHWMEKYKASGFVPSEVRRKKGAQLDELPVIMIATDLMSPVLWSKLEEIKV